MQPQLISLSRLDELHKVSTISGGISNALYKVTPPPTSGLEPVAFRVYGNGTEKFIDRKKELEIMTILHEHEFGPSLLGTFDNGRIEAFLGDMRCLRPEEMASGSPYVPQIAASLAKFHSIPAPESVLGPRHPPTTPFTKLRSWLDVAEKLSFDGCPVKADLYAQFSFDRMREEVDIIEQVASTIHSPTVFSHNDLLAGNIMVSDSRMTFIDFEYADWAPRGFDWGNHFCEYAGFDCDYSKYPTREAAIDFSKAYFGQDSTEDVEQAVTEANVYALAAHMYWGTWSILQASWSSIDFDYLSYGLMRWNEYYTRKDEFT